MPTFHIQSFGCRVNQAEAFGWALELQASGLAYAEDWNAADLVVVNSCTLTARADRDVRKFIHRVGRENPAARLIVTGCYAEREGPALAAMPGVAAVLGNSEKPTLPAKVLSITYASGTATGMKAAPPVSSRGAALLHGDVATLSSRNLETLTPKHEAAEPKPDISPYRARALVKVQDGCDNRCTFCVIPSVRGRSSSVGADHVAGCVRNLSARGYREIVLAGIHLSSWGKDLEPARSLTDLLRRIEAVEGLGRIRLSSLDPRRMDETFIGHVAGNPRVCQHFHLSLQHASEKILNRMGRGAGAGPEVYESILSRLRELSPDAALGADIIVGFPGETGEDFAGLESFLRGSPLTYFHVFSYSSRAGTAAARLPQVPDSLKKARSRALRRLSAEKNLRFRESFAGRELEAVVIREMEMEPEPQDGPGGAVRKPASCELLTGNYIKVRVPTCPAAARELVRVRVARITSRSTEGVMASG